MFVDPKRLIAGAATAVSLAFWAPAALAVPQLQLSDGTTTVTVVDQGAGDLDGLSGAIVFSGQIGGYFINVTTGITKPVLGTAEEPSLDLNSINVSGPGGGILTIRFTETDYVSNSGTADIFSAIGGVTAGTMQYQTFASTTNDPFQQDLLVSDSGFLSGPFVFSALSTIAISGSYSLTTVATITHTGAGTQNSSFNAVVELPEPFLAPPLVLGTLLLSATLIVRRRRQSA
jgi:hypothetical protein